MARILDATEQEMYIENREYLLNQLDEIQADLMDLGDSDLISLRGLLLERVNNCLRAVLEDDTDYAD